jgi:hypothetical protein
MAVLAVVVGSLLPGAAFASPDPNGAVVNTRVFNDCPISTVTVGNSYPSVISIQDDIAVGCGGFANLHNWRFSEDGGATEAVFNNGDSFRYLADLVISGTGEGEAGLLISPWWSQEVDGRFNVRTTDGEIACFGGRLPFFSFTAAFGLHYVKGTEIHLEVTYRRNGLSMGNPATIEYELIYNGTPYTSGPKPFDQGNPAEDPPHGLWGILNDARVGGHLQVFASESQGETVKAEWLKIHYDGLDTVSLQQASWGGVKSLYR